MSSTENISVHVRVRPLNDLERDKGKAWRVEGNSIYQTEPSTDQKVSDNTYKLDTVFDGSHPTAAVYEKTTQHLIHQVVEGFNSTVFAYGQTSSGKTHTMRGTACEPGIIPLAVSEIFSLIEKTQDREFLIRVSYMELYNEDINDLLAPENQKLQVHENKENGVYVAGLREDIVASPDQVMDLLEAGERCRHFGETKMNKQSSRSHTVFRMVVESRSRDANPEDASDFGAIRVSALTLVDLAGSERIAKTGAEGVRMKEGASINKSLLTLGTVINKLSEGVAVQGGHIPYRDSKLTRILQPSLGGNAKTAIICAVTPASIHVDETHSTLRFACRAKRVVNNATVNEVLSDAAVLKRQAKEIEELRRMLTDTGNEHIEEDINRLRAELLRKDQENERMSTQLAAEKEERERAQRKVHNMTRMMLDGGRSSLDGKPKKDNRRETWCPGAATRKRPLLPNLGSLLEDDDAEPCGSRKSEGALLPMQSEGGGMSTASPPHKARRKEDDDDEIFELDTTMLPPRPASGMEGDVGTLQARIRELVTQNALMQRDLDHMSEMAQRQDQQLKDAEDELVAVAEEKDKVAPQLEEAKWRNRQLEKELQEATADRDRLQQAVAAIEKAKAEAEEQQATNVTELQDRLQADGAENAALKGQVQSLTQQLESLKEEAKESKSEIERLESKARKLKQDADEGEKKLRAKAVEMVDAQRTVEAATEMLQESESRNRELYEENKRLTEHVSDLESRKRAPLYQKKQEEELKAAVDKAQECEIRTAEAERKYKEAKVAQDAAEKQVVSLEEEKEKLIKQAAEDFADAKADHEVVVQKLVHEQAKMQAKHSDAVATLEQQIADLIGTKAQLEATIQEKDKAMAELQEETQALQGRIAGLQTQLEETQQCADAATEHVQFLEEKAEQDTAAFEQALAAIQQELEAARGKTSAAEEALEAAKQQAAADLQTAQQEGAKSLQAAQEKGAADLAAAQEADAKELADAKSQYDALVHIKRGLEQQKLELEVKVAQAAASLNAADELKELRRKYKEETAKLNQQLKSASMGSKGNEKEADRLKKEIDKLRQKVTDTEAKLRTAVQDKNNFQLEKAALEREMKTARSQAEKLTKNMDKITGLEEKKRESIMVGFNRTKTDLQLAQEGWHRVHVELEKTQFELQVKKTECETLEAEFQESRQACTDLQTERDDLAAQLANNEAELQNAQDNIEHLRAETEATRQQLSDTQDKLAVAESRLPEIEELQKQLTQTQQEMTEAGFKAQDDKANLEAREKQLVGETEALQLRIDELSIEKQTVEAALKETSDRKDVLETEVEEKMLYISTLEGQINESMAENMQLQAVVEGANAQCQLLEQQCSQLQTDLQAARAELQSRQAQLESSAAELEQSKAEAAALSNELAEQRSQAAALSQQLQLLTEANSSSEEQKAHIAAQLAQLQSDAEQLRGEKEIMEKDMEARLQEAVDSAEKWKQFAEGLQSKQQELQGNLATLQAELQAAHDNLSAAQEACNDLDLRATQAEAGRGDLAEQFVAERRLLQAQLAELQANLQANMAIAEEANIALAAERQETSRLTADIQQLESELLTSTERLQQESAAAIQAAQQQLAAESARLRVVETELAEAEQRTRQAERERAVMERSMTSEIEDLQAALQVATDVKDAEHSLVARLAAERQAAMAAADRNAAEVKRLRSELAHLQRVMQEESTVRLAGGSAGIRASIADISDAQIMEVKEQAERKIAQLHSRIQQLQSHNNRLAEEVSGLQHQLATPAAAAGMDTLVLQQEKAVVEARCTAMEEELRKSKRREMKLQALQFRLREDLKDCGGDLNKFDQLKDMRGLQYDLDRVTNRATRDKQVLNERLQKALEELEELRAEQLAAAKAQAPPRRGGEVPLGPNKENC